MAELKIIAANNAESVLASAVNAQATTLTLLAGSGSLFPSPVAGETYFKLSLTDAATSTINEIVNVTARNGDVLTVERAQEGTTAAAWSANDLVANMLTAETINDLTSTYSKAEVDALGIQWAPPSAVMAFARSAAPPGWLMANGQAVSRTQYVALFTAIGTTYGVGDGSTTFNVPDLRGLFVRAWDSNAGVDPERKFASKQDAAFASHNHGGSIAQGGAHTHTVTGTAKTAGAHTHTYQQWSGNGQVARFSLDDVYFGNGTATTSQSGAHTHDVDGTAQQAGSHTHTLTIDNAGGSETRPVNMALLYCIKY